MSFKVNIVELDNLGKAVTNDGDLAEQEVKKRNRMKLQLS